MVRVGRLDFLSRPIFFGRLAGWRAGPLGPTLFAIPSQDL